MAVIGSSLTNQIAVIFCTYDQLSHQLLHFNFIKNNFLFVLGHMNNCFLFVLGCLINDFLFVLEYMNYVFFFVLGHMNNEFLFVLGGMINDFLFVLGGINNLCINSIIMSSQFTILVITRIYSSKITLWSHCKLRFVPK